MLPLAADAPANSGEQQNSNALVLPSMSSLPALTFVIAGSFAALAGTLYTLYIGFVSPVFIHPLNNVEVIFAALIGGAGNLYGALAGGVFYMVLRDSLSTHIPQWEWILGILLLIVVFYLREGITGFVRSMTQGILRKIAQKKAMEV